MCKKRDSLVTKLYWSDRNWGADLHLTTSNQASNAGNTNAGYKKEKSLSKDIRTLIQLTLWNLAARKYENSWCRGGHRYRSKEEEKLMHQTELRHGP